MSDNAFRVKLDLAALGPQVQVVEMLHKAAFRSGLGNSLFCSAISAGKVSPGALQQFTADNFRADNAAVVGVGIPHDILVSYAQSLSLKAGSGKVAASKMHAGEVRQETAGDLAFVAVAAAGASLDNAKNLVTFALLQRALGTGNCYFWADSSKIYENPLKMRQWFLTQVPPASEEPVWDPC